MKKENVGFVLCIVVAIISYFYFHETQSILNNIGNYLAHNYKLYLLLWCALIVFTEIIVKRYTATTIIIATGCITLIISLCSIISLLLSNRIEVSLLILLASIAILYTAKIFWERNDVIKANAKIDILNRARFYARIHTTIRRNSQKDEKSKVYAIIGEWGSGKTHLLEYLVGRLSKEYSKAFFDDAIEDAKDEDYIYKGKYSVCKLEIWKYKSAKQTSKAIIESLNQCVYGKHNIYNWRKSPFLVSIVSAILSYCKIDDFAKVVRQTEYENDIDAANRISKYLKRKKMRCILIMDDMERAKFEILKSILPIIDNLKKIDRLIIMCSLSEKEAVDLFTANKYSENSAYGYFRKVFDIQIRMPELFEEQAGTSFLRIIEDRYSYCSMLKGFAKKHQLSFTTPREVEQTAENLASLEIKYLMDKEYLLNEKNTKFDYNCIFLIEILRTQFPSIYQFLFENNDYLKHINEIPRRILYNDNFVRDPQFHTEVQKEIEAQKAYKKNYPIIHGMISSHALLSSTLCHLRTYFSDNSLKVEYAEKMEYINRRDARPDECRRLIHSWHATSSNSNLHDYIDKYYNYPIDADAIEDNILEYIISQAIYNDREIYPIIYKIAYAENGAIVPIFTVEHRRALIASFIIPLIHLYFDTKNNYLYNALLLIIRKIGIYHLYDTLIYLQQLSADTLPSHYNKCPFKPSLVFIHEHFKEFACSHLLEQLAKRYGMLFAHYLANNFENELGNRYLNNFFKIFDQYFFSTSDLFMHNFKVVLFNNIKQLAQDNQSKENILTGIVSFLCMKSHSTMPPVVVVSRRTYDIATSIINSIFGSSDAINVENFSTRSLRTLGEILLPLADEWPGIIKYWYNNDNLELGYYSGILQAHELLDRILHSLPKRP